MHTVHMRRNFEPKQMFPSITELVNSFQLQIRITYMTSPLTHLI